MVIQFPRIGVRIQKNEATHNPSKEISEAAGCPSRSFRSRSIIARAWNVVIGCLAVLGSESTLLAQPAQVILIRHGEKPPKGPDLDTKGRMRAAALVPYFLETPEMLKFGTPVAVHAQLPKDKPTATPDDESSRRPVQTVTPLANELKLTVTGTTRDGYSTLVQTIMTDPALQGKMVLLCWEHNTIPAIAQKFLEGYEVNIDPKNLKWPGENDYGRTWIITYTGSKKATFQDLSQRMMYHDDKE